jgi:hypothetical protein
MVTVVFQIDFHSEIHQNNFFYFLKINFDIITLNQNTKINFEVKEIK